MSSLQEFWFSQVCCICADSAATELCESCSSSLPVGQISFERQLGFSGWAILDYSEQAAKLIHAFKATGSRYLANRLASLWVACWGESLLQLEDHCEVLVLVPAPSRESLTRKRGFTPALLLARALQRYLNLLLRRHPEATLRTVKIKKSLWFQAHVADQSNLSVLDRATNLHFAMRSARSIGSAPLNRTIAIVDDVVTTGATVREATRALAETGNSPRFLFAIAETKQKIARAN